MQRLQDGLIGAVIAACVMLIFCLSWYHFHSGEEERLLNLRSDLNKQQGSIMFVVGYSPDEPIYSHYGINIPSDPVKSLDSKSEGHVYHFHDKAQAQKACQAMKTAVDKVCKETQ